MHVLPSFLETFAVYHAVEKSSVVDGDFFQPKLGSTFIEWKDMTWSCITDVLTSDVNHACIEFVVGFRYCTIEHQCFTLLDVRINWSHDFKLKIHLLNVSVSNDFIEKKMFCHDFVLTLRKKCINHIKAIASYERLTRAIASHQNNFDTRYSNNLTDITFSHVYCILLSQTHLNTLRRGFFNRLKVE